MRRWLPFLAIAPWAALAIPQNSPKKVTFAEVEPILRAHCTSCHSTTNKKGGLNLATIAGLKKGGINEGLIVAGKPERSLLLQRIHGEGGKPRMPMGFAPLTKAQEQTIADWIAQGASFDTGPKRHWAYLPPVRPKPPVTKTPGWVRNPIDAFVLARLEKAGLKPSPAASRESLIRRVTLDLTGLPPTPEEVDAFLADERPDAYERVVDRLLASPHYGERQAQVWLDLARYADSDGYEKDLRRSIWKYRDWLINAFNQNLPYDRFTVEQLAADLLPAPTVQQLIATGFNRNTQMNLEGGVDQEEAHFKVVLDRVDTTSTVWLGSTLACARCHDHKYDPFSQKDYYRMAAYFSNAAIYPRGPKEVSEEKWFEAELEVPTPQQAATRRVLEDRIAKADAALKTVDEAAFNAWKGRIGGISWRTLDGGGEGLSRSGDVFTVSGPNPAFASQTVKSRLKLDGVRALRLEALADPSLPGRGPGRAPNGNFVLSKVELKVDGKPVKFGRIAADFVQPSHDVNTLPTGDRRRGWAIHGAQGRDHELVLELDAPITTSGEADVEVTLECRSQYDYHNLGRFRFSLTSEPNATSAVLPADLRALLTKENPTAEERKRLETAFLTTTPVWRDREAAQRELADLKREIPTTLVMRDRDKRLPLKAFLRTRGEFLSKAEEVTAGTPTVLPPMPKALPANRLGLAKWLVRPDNPLTVRVQVNRMWQSLFGRGIVETSDDFGTQSSPPTHRELLDWLATEFMAQGWDMKAMNRLLVTSATYRQTSKTSPALLKRDPENHLLARGPRFRLDAEAIRDVALASAGILDRTIGGPSVYPYQPEGVWDSPYSGEGWFYREGKEARRRGMYTFWKRTATYPSFMAFDATSRETCTVRRTRTNTPLQALALLNDQGLVDAARALAGRMRKEASGDRKQIARGFRICTGRSPKPAEVDRLALLLAKVRTRYAGDPAAAKRLAGTPEDAAFTMVANVLLNLDETITKG